MKSAEVLREDNMTEMITANVGECIAMPEIEVVSLGTLGIGRGKIRPEGMEAEGAHEALVEAVKNNLVFVGKDAIGCCMDGRHCVHTLNGGQTEAGRVGTAGGDLISAHAAAELTGWYPSDLKTSRQKLEYMYEWLNYNGINPGVHCDDLAVKFDFTKKDNPEAERTGCAADDGVSNNLQLVYEDTEGIESIRSRILEGKRNKTEYVPREVLVEVHKDWRPTDMIDIVGKKFGEHGVEVLETDDTPFAGHHEVEIFVNDIEGFTLDRDGFAKASGKTVFFINLWRLRQIANAMASGPDAETQQGAILDGLLDYQFSTLDGVCDKSMPLSVLKSDYSLAA